LDVPVVLAVVVAVEVVGLVGWEGRGWRRVEIEVEVVGRGVASDSGSVMLGSVVEVEDEVAAEEVDRRGWRDGWDVVGEGVLPVTNCTISADLACQSEMVRR
jgi:hypothetical protein